MEVDFAFLADAAEVVNGKLYVMGGAIDTIWAPAVPVTHHHLAFVLRLFFSPAEVGRTHRVEIHIVDEDGKRIASISGDLSVGEQPHVPLGWAKGFLTVLSFANLAFEKFGDYSFEVLVNSFSVKGVKLRIAHRPPATS